MTGQTAANPLITELEGLKRRVERILSDIGDAVENGTEADADAALELGDLLETMFQRTVAGLERYGHADRARILETAWATHVSTGLGRTTIVAVDAGVFAESAGWRNLGDALLVLKDAIAHDDQTQQREKTKRAEEFDREQARRAEDHNRDQARRTQDFTEAEKTRESQRKVAKTTAIVAAGAVLAGGLMGNLDKLAKVLHGDVATAVWLEGELSVVDAVPPDLEIRCSPQVYGVVPALGPAKWRVGVLPTAPRPLRLFCGATARGYDSNIVTVDIGDESPARILPVVTVRRTNDVAPAAPAPPGESSSRPVEDGRAPSGGDQ